MLIRIIADLFLVIGGVFALAGTIGALKMPDTYSRMQASTCISTMGVLGVAVGALLYTIFVMGSASASIKVAVIALLIFVTNPVGSHAIIKGAYRAGFRPEKPMEVDEFRRDFDE
jgi:multicomponent Na+:H+ antiporter subunit G